MNTFTLVILSLDYHILLSLNKSIMSLPSIILGDLKILEIGVMRIGTRGTTPHGLKRPKEGSTMTRPTIQKI
jgi:hypothetical protein